jgi:hypothetical protein
MNMNRKVYEIKGMDKCSLSTSYRGVRVNLEFKGGDVSNKKNGTLATSDPFVQDAIEAMPSFGKKIVLRNSYELRSGGSPMKRQEDVEKENKPKFARVKPNAAELRKGRKTMHSEEESVPNNTTVVEDIKNVNDAASYFMEKGITVESKEQLKELMQKHDVEFPNLVME